MSPLELAREFRVAALRRQDDYNRDVTHAWNVFRIESMAMTTKRMPELRTLLLAEQGGGDRIRLTGHQRVVAAADLCARFGIRMRVKES